MPSRRLLTAAIFLCASLGGCATTPEQQENNDPFEPINRVMFDVNYKVEKYVGVPVAEVYVTIMPKPVRRGLHNALGNLSSPITLGNDILQGSPERALQTFYRFGINSTLGLGGLIDVASYAGVQGHTEDFGQTLGYYGMGEGPYLVLPLVGAAPPRDFGGHFVDVFMDPLYYMDFEGRHALLVGRHAAGLVDGQVQTIDAIKQLDASADPYAAARSAYRMHRDAEIRNGAPDAAHLPDITDVPAPGGPLIPIPRDSH
jgi:phospholipid-binding lipoprotein MlaA